MQLSYLAPAVALLGASSVLGQITVTNTPNSAQASQVTADINSYLSGVTTEAAYSSFTAFAHTADISINLYTDFQADISEINSLITATLPSQSAWPTEDASFFKSVLQAQASIYNKDVGSGAADTKNVKVAAAGAVLAAGFVAVMAL